MLMKHPGRCRFPHGHSRRVEIVLSSEKLDENDMVCDFQVIKLAVGEFLDGFDHAMAINSQDPMREALESVEHRLVVLKDEDPTTEVLARRIYEFLEGVLTQGQMFVSAEGRSLRFSAEVRVERVRVGETASSWAEYAR